MLRKASAWYIILINVAFIPKILLVWVYKVWVKTFHLYSSVAGVMLLSYFLPEPKCNVYHYNFKYRFYDWLILKIIAKLHFNILLNSMPPSDSLFLFGILFVVIFSNRKIVVCFLIYRYIIFINFIKQFQPCKWCWLQGY